MNRGFIVGKAFKGNTTASGVEVSIRRITGDNGLLEIVGDQISKTNSKGQFAIPFNWFGAELGNAILVNILLIAIREHQTNVSTGWRAWQELGKANVNGYLIRDVEALMSVSFTNFWQAVEEQNIPNMADFYKDFLSSYRKFSTYDFYKTGVWSTESWMLMAGGNILIK